MALTILHFSDLHYSNKSSRDQAIVFQALLNDLSTKRDAGLTPDLVIFSGDLVYHGNDSTEFKRAEEHFIEPLLAKCSISKDRFFIVPGNHDVQLDELNEYWESGLNSSLTSRDAVNLFIDRLPSDTITPSRFAYFNEVRQRWTGGAISVNQFWATYKIAVGSLTVGIACLNSAWRATGKADDFDYGKLLVGERQIDASVKDLSDCTLKLLVVHHPFAWLQPHDQQAVRRRALSEFDFIFFGHNHYPDPGLSDSTSGQAVLSNAGCLYQSRNYYNGYSLVEFEPATRGVAIHPQQYFDDRRVFDRGLQFASEGVKRFRLPLKSEMMDTGSVLDPIATLSPLIDAYTKEHLLSSIIGSTAPDDIRRIFVEPPLALRPEHELHMNPNRPIPTGSFLKLRELLASGDHLLFIGKKESGKSTLLNRSLVYFVDEPQLGNYRVPFCVALEEIRPRRNGILRALHDFSDGRLSQAAIQNLLRTGQCIVLMDGVPFDDTARLAMLRQFIIDYPQARLICTTDFDLLSRLKVKEWPDIGVELKKIYMHAFSRTKMRELVRNWFPERQEDVPGLHEQVVKILRRINVPRRPFLISLVLWILETQRAFNPLNQAALVDKFVNGLMERLGESEGWRGILDYRNKEHYLAWVAENMVTSGEYLVSRLTLERQTIGYFEARSLEASVADFIQYFVDRGIFAVVDDRIGFKYRCFGEFFAAKRMIDDASFYARLVESPRYLEFSNEFDYLTGLQRSNRSLIEIVQQRLRKVVEEAGTAVDLALFEQVNVDASPLNPGERETLIRRLKEGSPSDEERDELFDEADVVNAKFKKIADITTTPGRPKSAAETLLATLDLYSRLIRNCELIDDAEFKRSAVSECVRSWAEIALSIDEVGGDAKADSQALRRGVSSTG